MKNQIQKLKTKLTGRGSILVYTLIVMMIMLSTALSIFAVAVREKKGAGLTAASLQAFAVADSGSEIALNKIANVSTLAEVGICADGGVVTGSIGTGMDYTLTFYDSGGNQLLDCTDSVSAVDKVKSVGRYGGTARAVEVAVAQAGLIQCDFYKVEKDCNGEYCGMNASGWEPERDTTFQKVCNILTNGGYGITGTYKSSTGNKYRMWTGPDENYSSWNWSPVYTFGASEPPIRRISGAFCCK